MANLLARRGVDLDDVLHGASRSFAGDDLMPQLRRRPSAGLLGLLAQRLEERDHDTYRRRAVLGPSLARRIDEVVDVPGGRECDHVYWVFPVLADRPDQLVREARRAGFDATRRATLRPLVEPGIDTPRLDAAFARCVYLPLPETVGDRDVARLAETVRRSVQAPR